MSTLSFNPSYVTKEVTYGSCPCGSETSCTTREAQEWTKTYPLVHGDSVLGIYGATNQRFNHPPSKCLKCGPCENNKVTPLFYQHIRSITHPTYGFQYVGKDFYYRAYDM